MSSKVFSLYFIFAQIVLVGLSHAKTIEVSLSQKVVFKTGDIISLKNTKFKIEIGADKGSECAVPGFNCGSGYIPPHPTYKIDCDGQEPCPYISMPIAQGATTGNISIESEESCEKNDPSNCFRQFARQYKNDEGCMRLKSPLGRYYCLQDFTGSIRPENKVLCDQLPDSIFALKWNCYYDYAVRYKDPSFCEKYPTTELSGKRRCLLRMAELLKDQSFCDKITFSKEDSYKEQCLNLKK